MSGFLNRLREEREELSERHGDRHEARHERHDRGGRHDDHDDHDDHESRHRGQGHRYEDEDDAPRRPQSYEPQYQGQGRGYGHRYEDEDDAPRRPQSYEPQYQGQGRGYGPPAGAPPSARGPGSLGGLDRGDFASDADIDRMIASGEFNKRQGRGECGERGERGYSGTGGERGSAIGRYDTPSGPPPGQGYGERANDHGRYDTPSGPPPGRGYQSQQSHEEGYGSGGAYAASYGGGSERQNQYGQQQTQGRSQYETPQGPPPGRGRGQGSAPSGGFAASHDGEERYGGPPNDRSEPPRRGEAASYYGQQGASGQDDRYAHLAGIAQERGNGDPELYRQATQGLHEKIQSQGQSRRPRRDDDDHDHDDYKAQVDAHRKAYGEDDHGPMDADAIGAAAAMEAFKQTAAAGSSNAPAGAFQTGKASGGSSSKPGRASREEEEEEEDTPAARGGASGGMQDKLMALAMSQAGKLFDKKNAGSSGSGGGGSQDKAQAMQSAAATAMKLFTQYQTKGKLESGDMSQVMGLAKLLL